MDIILEAGLSHQQIPVDRLGSVFEKTRLTTPLKPYENPLIDHQDISTEWALRRIENTEELKPYNRKVMTAEKIWVQQIRCCCPFLACQVWGCSVYR